MKKISGLILFLLILSSCGEKTNTTIKGTLNTGEKKYIYLDYLKINSTDPVDSVRLNKKGEFSFDLQLEHPDIYILRNEAGKIITVLPHPGEEVIIEGDYNYFNDSYSVSGSEESEYIRRLVEKLQDTRKRLDELDDLYSDLSNVNERQASDYINRRKAIIKEQRDFTIQFIVEHLNSISSIYAIYQKISPGQYVLNDNRDIQYMKIVADSVSQKYPEVPFVKSFVKDARDNEQTYYNMKKIESISKGKEQGYPNLEIPDTSGDTIALSSLEGKTILLYFWSSFSEASRNQNISLKEIYDKNKDEGFEVYAVAMESERSEWLKAIRFDELDWINVSELNYPESYAALIYNVNNLPTSFLINKEGEIVARDIYGRELQKWLDNIL